MLVRGVFAVGLAIATSFAQAKAEDWTGVYAGVTIGAASGFSNDRPTLKSDSIGIEQFFVPGSLLPAPGVSFDSGTGFIGGGLIGINMQSGSVVFGLEADLSGADLQDSDSVETVGALTGSATSTLKSNADWLATLRGRIGYVASKDLLLFVTGGAAFGKVESSFSYSNSGATTFNANDPGVGSFVACPAGTTCFSGKDSDVLTGWTIGGGFEYAFSPSWSLKGEYLFVDLGSHSVRATGIDPATTDDNFITSKIDPELHVGRVGLNFKLN